MLANLSPVICGYVECWPTCCVLFVVMFVQLIVLSTILSVLPFQVVSLRGCSNNLIRKIKNKGKENKK